MCKVKWIYSYIITEKVGDTAGVEYYDGDILMVVTVVQGEDDQYRVAAIHTEDITDEDAAKNDYFTNTYYSGTLDVTKEVTGNMGDRQKPFEVYVTFTAPEGQNIEAPIYYTDDGNDYEISFVDTDSEEKTFINEKTVTITLKHDETVKFKNIPYGVKYTLGEKDYTGNDENDGYDPAAFVYDGHDKEDENSTTVTGNMTGVTIIMDNIIDNPAEYSKVINNKGTTVDTGISVDSIPYIAILGAVALGGTGFVVSKKRRSED